MLYKENEELNIDLHEILYVLFTKFWLLLILGIAGAVIGGLVSSYLIKPVYTSEAKVYVISRQDENKITYSDLQTGAQLTKDYMILVKSRPVTEKVINNLKLSMTSEQLSNLIEVNTPADTRILEIIVRYYDAVMAKSIVDTIAEVSAEAMVNVMEIEKVNIVEQGNLPATPSSPNLKLNIFLGGILGVLFPSMILIVRFLLNDAIKTQEDVENHLGLTLLGIIPMEEGRNKKNQKTIKKMKSKKIA